MPRVVSLLVVLAHLGVASIPCIEAEAGLEMLISSGTRQDHSLSAPAVAKIAHNAPEHATTSDARHGGHHQPAQPATKNAAHNGNQHATMQHGRSQQTNVDVVLVEMRAPCLCGCSKSANSPGTTSSPRLGFALFPPKPASLPELAPSSRAAEIGPMPSPLADVLEHVPIIS